MTAGLWHQRDSCIIPYQELLGNYDRDEDGVLHWLIIPYQELLGNYDRARPYSEPRPIIPYQELLGNYDFQIIDNALRCIIPYQHNMRRIYHKFSPQVLQRPAGFVII